MLTSNKKTVSSLRNERRNSTLMTSNWRDLVSASDWVKQIFNLSEAHYPDQGSDTSSVWNFCARFSDAI